MKQINFKMHSNFEMKIKKVNNKRESASEKGGVENKSSSFLFHLGFIEYLLNLLQVQ